MEKLIGYICSDMQVLKHDMCVTIRKFKKQSRVNNKFALLFILGGFYIAINEAHDEKMRKKIESLTKEVEELKKSKGE